MKKKHREKIYIFDFDHTLFDAKKFREDIGLLLANDKEMISEDIWNYFNAQDEKLFDFVWNKADEYVFTGVVDGVKKIKDEKILLTYGDTKFQDLKVRSVFFDTLFDKVFLTDENKVTFLKDFMEKNKEKKIIFINDTENKRFEENKEIKEKIPEIKVVEVDNYDGDRKKGIQSILEKL